MKILFSELILIIFISRREICVMKIKKQIAKLFTHPSKTYQMPIIMLYSNDHVVIEQHFHLISFTDSEIKLACKDGPIQIIGNHLRITLMYPGEIMLSGTIQEVKFYST